MENYNHQVMSTANLMDHTSDDDHVEDQSENSTRAKKSNKKVIFWADLIVVHADTGRRAFDSLQTHVGKMQIDYKYGDLLHVDGLDRKSF